MGSGVLSIRQFLAERKIKLEGIIKGTRFESMEAIKRAVTTELKGIPEESFQQCIETWQRRMSKALDFKGITLMEKLYSS